MIDLVGVTTSNASQLWAAAGFIGSLTFDPETPPQYEITWQSREVGVSVPCSSGMTVERVRSLGVTREPADTHLDVVGRGAAAPGAAAVLAAGGRVEDLQDEPLPVTLLDEQLVVVRLGDEIACFPDLCVHRGTALSLGWVDDGSQPAPDG